MVLNVPFSPRNHPTVTGQVCGLVIRESTDSGNAAIVIGKFRVAFSPVGGRFAVAREILNSVQMPPRICGVGRAAEQLHWGPENPMGGRDELAQVSEW